MLIEELAPHVRLLGVEEKSFVSVEELLADEVVLAGADVVLSLFEETVLLNTDAVLNVEAEDVICEVGLMVALDAEL